jgi:hypothetical protein
MAAPRVFLPAIDAARCLIDASAVNAASRSPVPDGGNASVQKVFASFFKKKILVLF